MRRKGKWFNEKDLPVATTVKSKTYLRQQTENLMRTKSDTCPPADRYGGSRERLFPRYALHQRGFFCPCVGRAWACCAPTDGHSQKNRAVKPRNGLPQLARSEEVHAAQEIRLVGFRSSLRQLPPIPPGASTLFRAPCERSINNALTAHAPSPLRRLCPDC